MSRPELNAFYANLVALTRRERNARDMATRVDGMRAAKAERDSYVRWPLDPNPRNNVGSKVMVVTAPDRAPHEYEGRVGVIKSVTGSGYWCEFPIMPGAHAQRGMRAADLVGVTPRAETSGAMHTQKPIRRGLGGE